MATHISELIIQALNLEIGDITISKTGARNAPIGRGTDLKTIRFVLAQKPTLTTPFTPMAFDDGVRVSLDIRADNDLEKSIKALDEKIRTYVIKNKAKFFKKPPTDEELMQLYTPMLRIPDDNKYSNTVRTKMTLGDKPSAHFWHEDKTPFAEGQHKTIDWRNSQFAIQVRLKSVWFQANKSYGATLEVEHILIKQADAACPFMVDEECAFAEDES